MISAFRRAHRQFTVFAATVVIGIATAGAAHAQASSLLTGRNIGAVGGAIGGGVLGKQIAGKKNRTLGIAAGAVGGGVLGAVAGNALDNSKRTAARRADPTTTGSVNRQGNSLLTGRNVGIVAGAVGGGVIGNKVAGKKNRALGTVAGAVGGGVLGGVVGNALGKR